MGFFFRVSKKKEKKKLVVKKKILPPSAMWAISSSSMYKTRLVCSTMAEASEAKKYSMGWGKPSSLKKALDWERFKAGRDMSWPSTGATIYKSWLLVCCKNKLDLFHFIYSTRFFTFIRFSFNRSTLLFIFVFVLFVYFTFFFHPCSHSPYFYRPSAIS